MVSAMEWSAVAKMNVERISRLNGSLCYKERRFRLHSLLLIRMRNLYFIFFLIAGFSVFLGSCEKNAGTNEPTARPSFDIIQEKILNTSCAISGCHSSTADPGVSQHGLLLTSGKSYAALVGAAAKNGAAAALGLKLVSPRDPENSFLIHKITCETGHHATASNFGAQMPLGGTFLTKGQVEFIRKWIINGASATDGSVNESLFNDSSVCQPSIEPLAPPPVGAGFQLKIDPFDVPPQFEREVFIRKNTPNLSTSYVNRIQLRGMSNSHHLVVYTFRDPALLPQSNVLRDLRNSNGTLNPDVLQNHIYMTGGSETNTDYTFPPGVAFQLEPNTPLDLNAHYFNRTNFTLKGENYINFYTVPASSVQHVAKTLDLNNTSISIPAGQRRTFTRTFTVNEVMRVIMLTSHTHKLGENFVIKIAGGPRNGEVVYTNTNWEHPLYVSFPNPIVLQPGQGLTSEVTYYNNTSKTVNFGLTSEDEMNIIFGYYY